MVLQAVYEEPVSSEFPVNRDKSGNDYPSCLNPPGQVANGGGEIDFVAVAPLGGITIVGGGKAALIERHQAPYLKSPIWIVGSRFPSIPNDATVFAAWKEPSGKPSAAEFGI